VEKRAARRVLPGTGGDRTRADRYFLPARRFPWWSRCVVRYSPEKLRKKLEMLRAEDGRPRKYNLDPRKVSLFFEEREVLEMRRAARRLERSVSQIAQIAWRIAREEMRKWPAPGRIGDEVGGR